MLVREDYELIKKVEYFLKKQSDASGGSLWTWALKVPHEERLEVLLHYADRATRLIKKLPIGLLKLSVKNLLGQFLKVMQEMLTQYFKKRE